MILNTHDTRIMTKVLRETFDCLLAGHSSMTLTRAHTTVYHQCALVICVWRPLLTSWANSRLYVQGYYIGEYLQSLDLRATTISALGGKWYTLTASICKLSDCC